MQEEVESRTVALIVTGTKMTGHLMKNAVEKYLAYRRNKRAAAVTPRGRQSVRQLVGQGQGVTRITLDDPSTRQFDRIARKYGVDYAVCRDSTGPEPKFLIFFKSKDAAALHTALEEYAGKKSRTADRPSVLEQLHRLLEQIPGQVRHRSRNRGAPVR